MSPSRAARRRDASPTTLWPARVVKGASETHELLGAPDAAEHQPPLQQQQQQGAQRGERSSGLPPLAPGLGGLGVVGIGPRFIPTKALIVCWWAMKITT